MTDEFTILVDTREQTPWEFAYPTLRGSLKTGDYSVQGLENVVSLERKSLGDLVQSVTWERERFIREVERLATFPVRAIVVEAHMGPSLEKKPRGTAWLRVGHFPSIEGNCFGLPQTPSGAPSGFFEGHGLESGKRSNRDDRKERRAATVLHDVDHRPTRGRMRAAGVRCWTLVRWPVPWVRATPTDPSRGDGILQGSPRVVGPTEHEPRERVRVPLPSLDWRLPGRKWSAHGGGARGRAGPLRAAARAAQASTPSTASCAWGAATMKRDGPSLEKKPRGTAWLRTKRTGKPFAYYCNPWWGNANPEGRSGDLNRMTYPVRVLLSKAFLDGPKSIGTAIDAGRSSSCR